MKRISVILKICLVFFLAFCVMPFYIVAADTIDEDYIISESNDFTTPVYIYNVFDHINSNNIITFTNSVNSSNQYFGVQKGNLTDTNAKMFYFKNGTVFYYCIAYTGNAPSSTNGLFYASGGFAGGAFTNFSRTKTIDNKTVIIQGYYHNTSQGLSDSVQFMKKSANTSTSYDVIDKIGWAVYYSYEVPEPPFNHGALNVGFYTRFGISGTNPNNALFKENIDVITWNNVDSNGNELNNLGISVNIRAVPITWLSTNESTLNSLGLADATSDVQRATYWNNINFNNNEFSLRWGDVIDGFRNVWPSWSFVKYFDDGYWYKNGWYYQIQYYDSGLLTDGQPYTSDWQTITTTTSVSVADAETVEHNYTYQIDYNLDPGLFNTIQNVNNDNSTTNNWYIDNLVINTEPAPEDSENWFSTLLQTIVQALKDLISELIGLFGKLIDDIFDLIESFGINFFGLISQLLNGIKDFFDNLDLTGINFQFPSSFNSWIQSFGGSVDGILGIWFNNGLGIFIMIPLIIWLIGVIL